MISIGILSTLEEPLLPFYFDIINSHKNIKFYIFISKKSPERVKKDKRLFLERTGKAFNKDLHDMNKISHVINYIDHPVYSYDSHNIDIFLSEIKKANIEYLFNANSPNKLNKKILNATKGVFNIHPGQLPYYQGCTCVEWALYNNDPIALSLHYMSEDYDAGPIIKIQYPNLTNCETYQEVRSVVYKDTLSMFSDLIKLIKNKQHIKSTKQSRDDKKYFKVISDEKLLYIKIKLENKLYKFSKENLS